MVGFVAGVILIAADLTTIGIIVALCAVPVALVVWIAAGERRF